MESPADLIAGNYKEIIFSITIWYSNMQRSTFAQTKLARELPSVLNNVGNLMIFDREQLDNFNLLLIVHINLL